jgi:hypothetical protein
LLIEDFCDVEIFGLDLWLKASLLYALQVVVDLFNGGQLALVVRGLNVFGVVDHHDLGEELLLFVVLVLELILQQIDSEELFVLFKVVREVGG